MNCKASQTQAPQKPSSGLHRWSFLANGRNTDDSQAYWDLIILLTRNSSPILQLSQRAPKALTQILGKIKIKTLEPKVTGLVFTTLFKGVKFNWEKLTLK